MEKTIRLILILNISRQWFLDKLLLLSLFNLKIIIIIIYKLSTINLVLTHTKWNYIKHGKQHLFNRTFKQVFEFIQLVITIIIFHIVFYVFIIK